MNKTISYKESTAIAIQAMMSAARKDEYADRKRKSNLRVGVNSPVILFPCLSKT